MKYEEVPDIISGKDLDYLSDMFNWNYHAYKKINNFIDEVSDEEIIKVFKKASDLYQNNLNEILQIIGGKQ